MPSSIVTPPAARSLTRNPMHVTMTSDLMSMDGPPFYAADDNLACHFEVWRDIAGGEEILGAALRSPYSKLDALTTFEISKLFPRVIAIPTAIAIGVSPGVADPYWAEAVGLVDVYRIKHADQFGDPVVVQELTVSDDYIAINGGLPADALQSINWAGALIGLHSYFYKHADAFTFRKPVAMHQPDFIYFVALVTDNIQVTVTRHYDDGTNDSYVSHVMAVTANKAYWTQAGFNQLKCLVDAAVGKNIIGYDVSLVRETGMQNAFTAYFTIDDDCPVWERFMLYHNGFGGYETVRMKGKTRYAHTVSRDTFERTRWIDFSTDTGTIDDLTVTGTRVYNTHTGHYPAFYIDHLSQLLHGKLWLIDMELSEILNSHRFLRIVCLTNSVELRTDDPAVDGFAIGWKPAWTDTGFNIY